MTFYISNPVQNDPNVLKQRCVDYMLAYGPPGWKLDGTLDLFAEFWSLVAAEQADIANALLDTAFRYIGGLANTPPIDATPAQSVATITVQDNAGYTVHAGGIIGIVDSTGTLQAFDLLTDLNIPALSTSGTVVVQAEESGTVCNGLSGTAQLLQVEPYVTAATMASSGGGIDAEDDPTFLDRLAETLTIQSPRFLLMADATVLARSVAGVFRAAGVDNLKPGPPWDGAAEASGVARNGTVAVTDVNGNPVGSTIRGNVKTLLQSLRPQNETIWVVDPNYTSIDVAAIVYAWPGQVTSVVQAAIIAALQAALSPAIYGTDPSGSAARWRNDPVIRAALIQQTIMSVPGVRYVDPQPIFGVAGTANIAAPAAPVPTQTPGGGTIPAGVVGVKVTYVNAAGETVGSVAGTVTTTGGASSVTVPSPAASGSAYAWYAYVTQVGGATYTRQQAAGSPTPLGTSLVLTAPPTSTGPQPPAVNTAENLSTANVTLGAGSAIPALPTAGTMTITVNSST